VDNDGFVKYIGGLAVVKYAPRAKTRVPNPLPVGGCPSSHCKTLVIISSLTSAVTHVHELGGGMLAGNDLACMDDKDEVHEE
jgi:hypothetical protein